MKILGLGHSHVVAVAEGCYALQHEKFEVGGAPLRSHFCYLYGPDYTPPLLDDGGLNKNLIALITRERPDFLVLCCGGNEHIALSIVQTKERIDFILGVEPDLPLEAGATILPEAAIRETLRDAMKETLGIMRAIRAATRKPIVVMEPPPPLPDARVLDCPKEFFHRTVDRRKLSTELFRYKVWRTQTSLYREICASEDMLYIPVPEDLIDPPGVLAQQAWGGDASHGNKFFGRRMIMRACEMIATGIETGVRT